MVPYILKRKTFTVNDLAFVMDMNILTVNVIVDVPMPSKYRFEKELCKMTSTSLFHNKQDYLLNPYPTSISAENEITKQALK